MAPMMFSLRISSAEPSRFPEPIFRMKLGISMPVGHAVMHGAS
jgi:hypothetical protein